jgi:hypothetical protein
LARYRELWQAAANTVVAPKLLVVLDPPREAMRDQDQLRNQIIEFATRPGQGPTLCLRLSEPTAVAAQLAAAIDAMK